MKKVYWLLTLIIVVLIIFIVFMPIEDYAFCETNDECNTDKTGDCAKAPFKRKFMMYDHPGCICENNQCAEAPCEPPCELG